MFFEYSPKVIDLQARLAAFMVAHIYPNERAFYAQAEDLGPWKVAASLLVAGVQALVLSVFFMDLKQADKLTWMCAGASVFWVAIMFTFTLTDYITRHLAAF